MSDLSDRFGKTCTCRLGRRTVQAVVFDWEAVKGRAGFLEVLFDDCEVLGAYPGTIDRSRGKVVWVDPRVPFALAGVAEGTTGGFVKGDSAPSFDRLLFADLAEDDPAVFAIEVDGTAIPAKKPKKVADSLEGLDLTPVQAAPAADGSAPSFEERAVLSGLQAKTGAPYEAGCDLLLRLTGDPDAGMMYVFYGEKRPKPPADRDPRWVTALGEELQRAMRAVGPSSQGGVLDLLVGALVTFGPESIPAFAEALAGAGADAGEWTAYALPSVVAGIDKLKARRHPDVAPRLAALGL